ncbi:hypothetical protein JIN86_18885 [Lysinibacillus sp. HST-98]|uniref:Z1 domain-containing protein n=1 Tax=Lysinibacillus sp. HST-98 TaxID=2800419 RepID=UPI001926490F|nr:Z1 domain-containing protein [Lysinibacillus sp. HST-98]MBL3731657.1 hypothetical protein [Lysinibacillus sp. HST-98]
MSLFEKMLKQNPHLEENKKVVFEIEAAFNKVKNESILLKGYVQSGKTATYLLTAAKMMDEGVDYLTIFTKNINDLSEQTKKRTENEFDEDVEIIDLDGPNVNIARYQIKQKAIFVLKKNPTSFEKLNKLVDKFPEMQEKKWLIIDDEADFYSVGYNKRSKGTEEYFKKICRELLLLRKKLTYSKYLAVTATPVSLYFSNYWMIRPEKTILLPAHSKYLGAEELFLSDSSKMKRIRENFVTDDEFRYVMNYDPRVDTDVTKSFPKLMQALIDFVISGILLNKASDEEKLKHYSMLIHIETTKKAHAKQKDIIEAIQNMLIEKFKSQEKKFMEKLSEQFNHLLEGMDTKPDINLEQLLPLVLKALEDEMKITVINSNNKQRPSTDKYGNIKNVVPFSIYIGAYAVDRGVTFPNLISFIFGRASKTVNFDSSMQQLRILGARPKSDLACTRIYCTEQSLEVWQMFAEIDKEFNKNLALLDKANKLASKTHLGNQMSYLIPATTIKGTRLCAANKVEGLMNHFTSSSRILPKGFTPLKEKAYLVDETLQLLEEHHKNAVQKTHEKITYWEITTEAAQELVLKSFEAIHSDKVNLLHILENSLFMLDWLKTKGREKVLLMERYNRKRKLIRADGKYDDAPDSGKGGDFDQAKEIGEFYPVLMMLHQDGSEAAGVPYFWPVLVMPQEMPMNISYVKEK